MKSVEILLAKVCLQFDLQDALYSEFTHLGVLAIKMIVSAGRAILRGGSS